MSAALVVLNNPKTQEKLSREASDFLSKEFETNVRIGKTSISFFNKITFYDVCIEGQKKDSLFKASELHAKVDVLLLFQRKIVVQQLKIKNMHLYLKNDIVHGNNFDFFIAALQNRNKTQKRDFFYQFKSVQFIDCEVRYTSNRKKPKKGIFDINNLEFKNLNLKIAVNQFSKDSLSARLKNFSFKEKSGLTVKNISAVVHANNKNLDIEDFSVLLPQTTIKTKKLHFDYKSYKSFNHFLDSVSFNIGMSPSVICLADLASFFPKLKNMEHTFLISGELNGPIAKMNCPELNISYGNSTKLSGNFSFKGLPNIDNTFISARVSNFHTTKNDLEDLIADFKQQPYQLPQQLKSIRFFTFKGKLNGYLSDLVASGYIGSNIGNINTEFWLNKKPENKHYTYQGKVETKEFQLGKFMDNKELGNISLNIEFNGEKTPDKAPNFNVKGLVSSVTYKTYTYNNIELNGFYEDNKFNGKIFIDDENGKAQIDGLLDFSKDLPFYDLTAKVEHFQPSKMNLTKKYPDLIFSFNINTKVSGNKLANLAGNIVTDSISIKNGDKRLAFNKFELISDISDSLSSIVITSDYVNGVVEGKYTISTLVTSIKYVASQYLPVLNISSNKEILEQTTNNFDFGIRVNNLDSISSFLDLKWRAGSDINIFGYYDDKTRKFRIKGIIPEFTYNKTNLTNISFLCENPEDDIRFAMDAKYSKNSSPSVYDIFFRAHAKQDSLVANIQWNNNEKRIYAGDVSTITTFLRNPEQKLTTETNILPTNIIISDTIWNVKNSIINTEPGKISINNLHLENKNQAVNIDGIASKSSNDSITLSLNNIRLSYLEQFLNMGVIKLEGKITGEAIINSALNNPSFRTNLGVKDFSFNKSYWGDLTIQSELEKENKRLNTNITVVNGNNKIADMSGYIYLNKAIDLDLIISASNLRIEFLQPFLSSILQNVTGAVNVRKLKMFGPLTKPKFEGNLLVKNGNFDIDFLKTNYTFTDTIKITENSFKFNKIKVYDIEGNYGRMSGNIQHNSYKNFVFNISGNCKNIIGLNTKRTDNENFYGKIYGTGSIRIYGNSQDVTFDIGMKTEPKSRLYIPFSSSLTASENTFITFVDRKETPTKDRQKRTRVITPSKTNIKLNLQIDATPNGQVQLLIDPEAGDLIKANGSGSLKLVYNNQEDIKLYGNYVLSKGIYHFTLQNVIRKDFKIKEGSTIVWNGSPFTPDININAYYSLSASLLDILDESMLTDLKRSTVPVNCLLNLTGDLTKPNIKFDIELPSNNDELERRVKNVISSEEMMNREIMYLLTLGRFYRPEYMTSTQQNNNELTSLVSSTLSSQLNHWLSQINDNLSMGVNYRSASEGELSSTEVEVNLGAEILNNRLIFNGNIGYKEDQLTTSNFIGDFDVEYKLNRSGKLRAKAYTHSNDKYYIKNTTTQGAGIIYKEEFNTFGELMTNYWNRIFNKPKKEEKEEEQTETTEKEKQKTSKKAN